MSGIVLVGASTGAPSYHHVYLRRWPTSLKCPLVLIQHMPPGPFLEGMFQYISKHHPHVRWAETGVVMKPGFVYMVRAEQHVRFNPDLSMVVASGRKENYFCPSMDVTFSSAAKIFGKKACAIMCSGLHANYDGLNGCRTIRNKGGKVIIASSHSVECAIMVRHVKQAGEYDHEVPLDNVLECAAESVDTPMKVLV